MAPDPESHSSSDDEAPETFTLSQSKSVARKQNDTLRQLEVVAKQKKRANNRERDRKLKEQAEQSRKKRKIDEKDVGGESENEEEEEEENGVEARMLRAMKQAAEEESGEESGEGSEGDKGDEDEMDEDDDDEEASEGEDSDEEVEDEEMGEIDEEGEDDSDMEEDDESEFEGIEEDALPQSNSKHLPDHLFSSAFSSQSSKKAKPVETKAAARPSKKRKRGRKTPKDLIVGSRAIRALSTKDDAPRASPSMLPSAKVKKFFDRSLSLRGNNSKSRGWERRAANLGSMRRQGPAAQFVRGSVLA